MGVASHDPEGPLVRGWAGTMTAIINIVGAVVLTALGVGMAAPASADPPAADDATAGYVAMLELAGLIDHDGNPCNIVNGLCHGQFDDGPSSVPTGTWVCSQIGLGRSRDSIVDELSHGEGLMPSSYNAPVIYDAADAFLC
jgi:hypothetical protein